VNPALLVRTINPATPATGSVAAVAELVKKDKLAAVIGAVSIAPGISPVPQPIVASAPMDPPIYVAGLPEAGMTPGPAEFMAPTLSPPVFSRPSPASPTDPNLPVPGHSGLGWIRDSTPLNDVPDAPPSGFPGATTPGAPVSIIRALAEPNSPTTAENPARFDESVEDRHARMFRRLPDIGGAAPWQGVKFTFPNGRVGGVPEMPAPVLDSIPMVSPALTALSGTNSSRSTPKDLRTSIAMIRRGQKRAWNMVPGLGGLDVAMGVRQVPDSPDGAREAISDKRELKVFGGQALQTGAPNSVVSALAIARKETPTGQIASVPQSTEVTTIPTTQALKVASDGKAAPMLSAPLIVLAVVALLFLRR
jgi:hypothetical protein